MADDPLCARCGGDYVEIRDEQKWVCLDCGRSFIKRETNNAEACPKCGKDYTWLVDKWIDEGMFDSDDDTFPIECRRCGTKWDMVWLEEPGAWEQRVTYYVDPNQLELIC